jgi:hypothetical protein
VSRSRTPFGRPCLSLDDAACLQLELAGAVSLENVALWDQLAVLQRSGGRPHLRRRDCNLLGRPLTARGELAREPDPRPPRNGRRMASPRSSVVSPERTQPGAGAGSKRNPGSSASRSLGSPLPSTCGGAPRRATSTWRTFLEAHICDIVAVDFFIVPTLTFRLLFGFLIL